VHVKTIKGKKYYYESVRVGKKVMSKYIGPVDKVKKEEVEAAEPVKDENFYLG